MFLFIEEKALNRESVAVVMIGVFLFSTWTDEVRESFWIRTRIRPNL